MNFLDAQQQALSFLINQQTHIEPQVYQIQYPDIQYPNLVPIDTSANEWARTITFFSSDKVGQAKWFSGGANDMARAETKREKFEHEIHMAGIGYGYDLEELGTAMLVPGSNLSADRAAAARRAYEEFMDDLVLNGDANKGLDGLFDYTGITATPVAADGTGSSPDWADKTPDQIIRDFNDVLTGVYVNSKTVETADTVLLPVVTFNYLASTRVTDTSMTLMQFLMANNVYTAQTGQQLMVRAARGLETAGDGGSGRMIAYRRDPSVLKVHLPMPHRFLPVWQTGPIRFDVPGIFRTGGLEIRRPGAFRYADDVHVPATA